MANPYKQDVCPHCKSVFSRLYQHEPSCVYRPEVRERVKQFLEKNSSNGIIMPSYLYGTRSKGTGIPSLSSLTASIGEWAEVAAFFGFEPYHPPADACCPHCQRELTERRRRAHGAICPKNPLVRGRVSDFLAQIAEDGQFPSIAYYGEMAKALSAKVPPTSALIDTYGSWTAVAVSFGMQTEIVIDREETWAALAEWFKSAQPPYLATEWNAWAIGQGFLPTHKIALRWGVSWRDIVEEMVDSPYPVRHAIEEVDKYRPIWKIPAWMKDRAEMAVAHIEDEAERAREWFRLLALPQPETIGEMGD